MEKFTKNAYIKNEYISASKKYRNSVYNTHWHEFFEIEYILSGHGSYVIDGIEYPIEKGLLFFMTPIDFHRVEMKDTELYNIMFTGNICNSVFLSRLTEKSPLVLKVDNSSHEYFKNIMDELVKNQTNLEFSSVLLEAIIAKLSLVENPLNIAENSSLSQEVKLYILNNFRNKITLNDVAKHVMLSPNYLSEQFKKETGINFKSYLNSMRYEYAQKLLAFSDMTVLEICNECGFSDYPNFVRRFKQHIGIYPNEYRKQNKNKKILSEIR